LPPAAPIINLGDFQAAAAARQQQSHNSPRRAVERFAAFLLEIEAVRPNPDFPPLTVLAAEFCDKEKLP
jgi:hypothetical protein